jgi:hypothetical protein
VVKKTVEEVASREVESALKEIGEHRNLICIWCRNVFPGGRTPLQYNTVRDEVVCNQLADLAFIYDGQLEQVRVRGGHDREGVSLQQGINASARVEIARK